MIIWARGSVENRVGMQEISSGFNFLLGLTWLESGIVNSF